MQFLVGIWLTALAGQTLAMGKEQPKACVADDNYGLFRGTMSIKNFAAAAPHVQTFHNLTAEECCHRCFDSTQGCSAWAFGGNTRDAETRARCSMSLYKDGCPSTDGVDTFIHRDDSMPYIGMGGCNVVADHHDDEHFLVNQKAEYYAVDL